MVDGFDISPEMIAVAKTKNVYRNFFELDLTQPVLGVPNDYAALISSGTFTHGHVGPNSFDELLRITKPGGLFVLSINSKVFIKGGFQEKFLKIKNNISAPIFNKFNAHGDHKDKKFSEIKIFASIFRKKLFA